MATTNLNRITVGPLEIQSGLGTPNHASNSGTTYTDLTTGLRYMNNGSTNWSSDKGFDTGTLTLSLDGGGVVLTTGVKMDVFWNFPATINSWTIFSDLTGNTIVDIWKSTYATFPPVSGGTITDAEKPTLANSDKNQDLSLTGFQTTVTSGDIWRVYVSSATTVTRVTVIFNYTKI